MSGTHLDPEGNIYERASNKIALMVAFRIGRKTVPVSIDECNPIAAAIVRDMELCDLFAYVYAPDDAVVDRFIERADFYLDWAASFAMVHIFAEVGGLAEIPEEAAASLARKMVARLCDLTAADEYQWWRWPEPERIQEMARRRIPEGGIGSIAELEAAVLPVVGLRQMNPA